MFTKKKGLKEKFGDGFILKSDFFWKVIIHLTDGLDASFSTMKQKVEELRQSGTGDLGEQLTFENNSHFQKNVSFAFLQNRSSQLHSCWAGKSNKL